MGHDDMFETGARRSTMKFSSKYLDGGRPRTQPREPHVLSNGQQVPHLPRRVRKLQTLIEKIPTLCSNLSNWTLIGDCWNTSEEGSSRSTAANASAVGTNNPVARRSPDIAIDIPTDDVAMDTAIAAHHLDAANGDLDAANGDVAANGLDAANNEAHLSAEDALSDDDCPCGEAHDCCCMCEHGGKCMNNCRARQEAQIAAKKERRGSNGSISTISTAAPETPADSRAGSRLGSPLASPLVAPRDIISPVDRPDTITPVDRPVFLGNYVNTGVGGQPFLGHYV